MSDALLLDLLDPQSRLVAVDKGSGSLVEDLRDDCGGIIQGLDWIVRKFTSYDLIAMIFDPISGDFAGVEALQDVWRAASAAMGDVAGNYGALSQALPSVWEGDAAASAAHRILRMARASTSSARSWSSAPPASSASSTLSRPAARRWPRC